MSTPSLLKSERRKKMAQNCFPFLGIYVCIYYNTCSRYILGVVLEEKKMFFRDVGCQLLACLLAWMVKLNGGGGKNKA